MNELPKKKEERRFNGRGKQKIGLLCFDLKKLFVWGVFLSSSNKKFGDKERYLFRLIK